MIRENTIIPKQKEVVKYLKKQGVTKAGVFGSYARGEQKKRSDVDLLVKVKRGTSLLDLIRFERELKNINGHKFDIITYNQIHPLLEKRILEDEVVLI